MSTALVSTFMDMTDVLHHNHRNLANNRSQLNVNFDKRAVGSPVVGAFSNNSRSQQSSVDPMSSAKFSPPTTARLISLHEAMLQNQSREPSQGHRKLDRSVSEPADPRNQLLQSQAQQQKNINSSRYKTELCRPFEENGYCKYGDKCQFAHGMQELRSLSRHPKYKTELCRTFHTIGFCPYGPRCHFIHSEDDRKLNQISQLKQQQAVQQLSSQLSQPGPQVPSSSLRAMSQPMPVQRPKALNFSMSLPPMMRESLGSCADSPPSSVTSDSPTMSPTLLREQDFYTGFPSAFSPPPATAPPAVNSAFTFQDVHATAIHQNSSLAPLNVQTDPIASLAAGLQAASLNQRNGQSAMVTSEALRDCLNDLLASYGHHSPDSVSSSSDSGISTCGSPLEVSRGLRLPIFSRLVNDE